MKHATLLLTLVWLTSKTFCQTMHVKQHNFTGFNTDKKVESPLLNRLSSPSAKQHPEYGVLPYNAQCAECVELIDKRTIDSRQFIDPKNAGHTYSQRSYFPLHYKTSETDIWRTIDQRLRPTAQPGVYEAKNQPVPTKCDLNRKTTSLNLGEVEFEFNKNLDMYFFDDNTVYTLPDAADYSHYTIGEEGLEVKNAWPGINMQQRFSVGEIETDYIINAPLQLPLSHGFMVIEDHFSLHAGYSFEETAAGTHFNDGYYQGDYVLKNAKGEVLLTYEKPVYVDAKAFGQHGKYLLQHNGNNYTLKMMVPVEWLNKTDNTYPLLIDPRTFGSTKLGDFRSTGGMSANLAFTSLALGSCDYHMNVAVPGKSTLTNAYVDIEYLLTYDNTCGGSHPLPPPFCTFNQVMEEVICDACNTTSGWLSCNPAHPPFTGTCTTDSVLVPGANSAPITIFNPNYLTCYAPQCADYNIAFTLKNRDSVCGDQCGYLCARGSMWRMTIEANPSSDSLHIYSNGNNPLCAGDSIILTANSTTAFSPTTYVWHINSSSGDTTNDNHYVIQPNANVLIECEAIDSCHHFYSGQINLTVISGPTISGSGNTLTASGFTSYQWYLNGSPLNDTTNTCIMTQPGSYTVRGSDSSGCRPLSVPFVLTGLNELTELPFAVSIIPNPNAGDFKVYFTSKEEIPHAMLRLYNNTGQLINTETLDIVTGENTFRFQDKQKLSAGIYWIELEANKKFNRQKVLITN